MTKNTTIIAAVAIILALAFGYWWYAQVPTAAADYTDVAIVIGGETVQLVDGVGETESVMGSAGKSSVRYFGNETFIDLDGDNREDVVFLITQETGGSGTFFYAVGALNTVDGYVGTHAVLIGDRIAPQTVEAQADGTIVVNYADRKPGEPFTSPPSVGKSLFLKYDPASRQFGELVQNFEGESACPSGTARVGEGCMPLKDECENRGDGFHFNETTQKCLAN